MNGGSKFDLKKMGFIIASVTFLGGVGVVKPEILSKIGCEALDWGPGFLLAVLMLYGLYLIAQGLGVKLLMALDKPATALTAQADALGRQSASMDRLTQSLDAYVTRDQSEHREIILMLKVINDRMDRSRETTK